MTAELSPMLTWVFHEEIDVRQFDKLIANCVLK